MCITTYRDVLFYFNHCYLFPIPNTIPYHISNVIISPLTADEKGLFVSLAVNDKATQSISYSVPVSWGEMKVFQTIASYSIPRFLGFDQVWDNPQTPGTAEEESR